MQRTSTQAHSAEPAPAVSAGISEVSTIEIGMLLPAESPRLAGEDQEHIRRLAEADTPLPPILVHRSTMRVIDGMHRLQAAVLRGCAEIEVRFFDGTADEAFIRAVRENVMHGLPLSLGDRKAAAERIIDSHPQLSDRVIATYAGLAAKTVAAVRERSNAERRQSNARLGADGRLRPLAPAEGRRRAADIIAARPGASLREVARDAQVSLGTAHDVRKRMQEGLDPVLAKPAAPPRQAMNAPARPARPVDRGEQNATLESLMKDPSLRHTEGGRELLRWLRTCVAAAEGTDRMADSVPAHCADGVAGIARYCASLWNEFADAAERRGKITL